MFLQIAVGTVLLMINISFAAMAAIGLETAFVQLHDWLMREPHRPKLLLLLIGVSTWVLMVVTFGVWVWAVALYYLEGFQTLEEAVYFALVCFTTLGLGDVILPHDWRILAGMTAANGFLTFGLLTALLVEALRQIRLGQLEQRRHRQGQD